LPVGKSIHTKIPFLKWGFQCEKCVITLPLSMFFGFQNWLQSFCTKSMQVPTATRLFRMQSFFENASPLPRTCVNAFLCFIKGGESAEENLRKVLSKCFV
jgi:hypothetical protein